MEYDIRSPNTVALRQGTAVAVSPGWCPPALRKTVIAIAGFAVLMLGVAFIFLPAPSIVVIPLGLAILAREFPWARRVLDWSREHARRSWMTVRDRLAKVLEMVCLARSGPDLKMRDPTESSRDRQAPTSAKQFCHPLSASFSRRSPIAESDTLSAARAWRSLRGCHRGALAARLYLLDASPAGCQD